MLTKKLDRLLTSYIRSNEIQCCAVQVSRNGELIYTYEKGYGDRDGNQVTVNTIFQVTSVTKPVTAALLMLLRDEGKLDVLDHASRYDPTFLVSGRNDIRLIDLLTHTSGLMDVYPEAHILRYIKETYGITVPETVTDSTDEQVFVFFEKMAVILDIPELGARNRAPEKILYKIGQALIDSLPPLLRPGQKCCYCNYGYNVVSRIITSAAGESFDLFAEERLFSKLKMDSTFWKVPGDKRGRVVKRYKPALAANWLNADMFLDRTTGCDGLKTTAPDMLKFLNLLVDGGKNNGNTVLSKKSVNYMTQNINAHVPLDSYFSAGFHLYDAINGENDGKRPPGSINHGGMGGSHIYMDPLNGICVGFFSVKNKQAEEENHFGAFTALLYDCLN